MAAKVAVCQVQSPCAGSEGLPRPGGPGWGSHVFVAGIF